MKRIVLFICIVLYTTTALHAQKKSELIAEIKNLNSRLDSTKAKVREARKNEKISLTNEQSFKEQVKELQEANSALLKNLNSFAEVSSKNSDAVNRTMLSLEEKENQLKKINNSIARNDSTAIVVLSNAKQTLGEEAKITFAGGGLNISVDLAFLFGNTVNTTVSPTAEIWLEKIAAILKANPNMSITIEGLSMTGELDMAAHQATSVASTLQKNFAIDPSRIMTRGKDGNFKEGVNLKIHPKFDQFYLMVRENMRNTNKK